MPTLTLIFKHTGISIKELAAAAQLSDRNIVTHRVKDFIKMYEEHPEKLDELVKAIVEDGNGL